MSPLLCLLHHHSVSINKKVIHTPLHIFKALGTHHNSVLMICIASSRWNSALWWLPSSLIRRRCHSSPSHENMISNEVQLEIEESTKNNNWPTSSYDSVIKPSMTWYHVFSQGSYEQDGHFYETLKPCGQADRLNLFGIMVKAHANKEHTSSPGKERIQTMR